MEMEAERTAVVKRVEAATGVACTVAALMGVAQAEAQVVASMAAQQVQVVA